MEACSCSYGSLLLQLLVDTKGVAVVDTKGLAVATNGDFDGDGGRWSC